MATDALELRRSPIPAAGPVTLANGVELADLTLRPRAAAKGPGLPEFLRSIGVVTGGEVNRAYRQPDGSLAALLSATEVLWLAPDAGEADLARWRSADGQPLAPDTYALPRRDGSYWFRLTGDAAAHGFSRLCGVDLSPAAFADLAVAQTLIARVSAVIIRDGASYHIIGDVSLAAYVWAVLVDAMRPSGRRLSVGGACGSMRRHAA